MVSLKLLASGNLITGRGLGFLYLRSKSTKCFFIFLSSISSLSFNKESNLLLCRCENGIEWCELETFHHLVYIVI